MTPSNGSMIFTAPLEQGHPFHAGGVRAALPRGAPEPSMPGEWGRVPGKHGAAESDGWLYTLGEFCSTCMFYIYIRAL